jgi:hypothetical protein
MKVLPGVRLNLSKSGISTTLGPRGAKVTLNGKGQRRTTVGIPGTGISHTTVTSRASGDQDPPRTSLSGILRLLGYGIAGLFVFMILKAIFFGS